MKARPLRPESKPANARRARPSRRPVAVVLLVLLALVAGATASQADVSRPLKRFMVFGENPFGCVVVGHDLVLDPVAEAVVARASTECDVWAGFKLRQIGVAATIEEHHWYGWNDVATQVLQDGAERTRIDVEARISCKHDQRYRLMAEGRVKSDPTDIGSVFTGRVATDEVVLC